MRDDDFTLAKTSPLLANQRAVLVTALDAALQVDGATEAEFARRIAETRHRLVTDPAFKLDRDFTLGLLGQALMKWQMGALPTSLAWARCVYIITRRIADGWLPFLNYLIDARIFPAARLQYAKPAARNTMIPRTIIQYWDKPVPPSDVMTMIETWRSVDGYSHRLVDHFQAQDFLDQHFPGRIRAAYDGATHVAGKADVFRLAWLYKHGGIYVDADEKLAGPLDAMLPVVGNALLTWSKGQPPCVNNWFIAVEPASPLIRAALLLAAKRVEHAVREGIKMNAWMQTGPGVISMAVLDDFAMHGQPDTTRGLFLMTETELRKVVHSDEFLEYRRHPEGNWRLEAIKR